MAVTNMARGSFIEEGHICIESHRMTSSAPMESADQTAWAGGRASTTMAQPPAYAV